MRTTDAIVNAANTSLQPGGGVDGAITRAAGAEALAERRRLIAERGTPPLPTGSAVTTGAGNLRCRWIIHTAGPVYSGTAEDRRLLAGCYRSSLAEADRVGAASVAFPAISCGVYGYPPGEAAPVAIATIMGADTKVIRVEFVVLGEAMERTFGDAIRGEAGRHGWSADDLGRWSPADG